MDTLCEFIVLNIDSNLNEEIHNTSFSNDELSDLDDCINIISEYLELDKENIIVNKSNLFIQRATVISFIY